MSFKDFSSAQTSAAKITQDNNKKAGEKSGPPTDPAAAPAADAATPAKADPAPKA